MGKRRERRLRYVSALMKILEDGKEHTVRELANGAGLTTREVSGILRGEDVIRRKVKGVTSCYSKPQLILG